MNFKGTLQKNSFLEWHNGKIQINQSRYQEENLYKSDSSLGTISRQLKVPRSSHQLNDQPLKYSGRRHVLWSDETEFEIIFGGKTWANFRISKNSITAMEYGGGSHMLFGCCPAEMLGAFYKIENEKKSMKWKWSNISRHQQKKVEAWSIFSRGQSCKGMRETASLSLFWYLAIRSNFVILTYLNIKCLVWWQTEKKYCLTF